MDIPASAPQGLRRSIGVRPAGVLHLAQLVRVLRRHLPLIVLCGVLAALAAYAVSRTLPKVYTADSAITVEGDRFAIPELQGALRSESSPDPMPWVRTEVQALSSRTLLNQVIAELHLADDPEFNPALRPPGLVQVLRDRVMTAVLPLLPTGPDGAPVPGPDEAVLAAVGHALSVFQDNRSLVIALSFTAEDPRRAAEILNSLIAAYVTSRASRRISANATASTNIAQRIDQVRSDLAGIEEKMRTLRSQGDLVGVRAGSVGQQQAEELATASAKAALERSQLEISFERANAAVKSGSSDALAAVLNSPTIARFREQEGTAARHMAELSSRYGANYPGVQSAGAEVGAARRQIAQEASRIVVSLGAQLRVAREQEADVLRQLDEARKSGVKAENSRAELDQLQQEATSRRALYQTLMERAQQTVSQPQGAETIDVRVISVAVPPGLPSGPKVKLASVMGGAGGLLLGCLIAVMRIRSVDGFETAADVTEATGLPVLASIGRGMLRPGRGLLARRPVAGGADLAAFQQLGERLRFSGRHERPRTVAFIPVLDSPVGALCALALARAGAASGERPLLVQGGAPFPVLRRLLGLDRGGTGLTQVLDGSDWQEAVVTSADGLHVLATGAFAKPARNPDLPGRRSEGGAELQNLLVEAGQEYDLVVMDASPATRTGSVSQFADVVVLVIEPRTPHAALHEALARLGTVSRSPAVAVLITRT